MKGNPEDRGFATRAIHAGQPPDPATGAVTVPIYQTSTYVQEELGRHKGYEYARVQNPTRSALEENVASLEGGTSGHAFASGMAAIAGLLTWVRTGEHVVVSRNVYGGTYRYFTRVLSRHGLEFSWVDTTDPASVRAAFRETTRLLFVETPTNPMMEITDLTAAAEIADEHDALLAVDNTFLSPYLQRPLALGARIVVHSTTKYLNGHSDGLGGVLVTNHEELGEWLAFVQKSAGGVMSPLDAFLVLRGIKTLSARMDRHESNARSLARFLDGHGEVLRTLYPGLPSHPGHEIQRRQADGFGGMLSFDVGSLEAAKAVLDRLEVFSLAESLGGVESLASHPASMTHASVPPERREELGIGEGLIRLSVGIEEEEDLRSDLEQALAAL